MADGLSRRQFFRLKPADLARGVVERREGAAKPRRVIRPPGAVPDVMLTGTCLSCRKCSQACPYDVIEHLGPAAGPAEGTPYLSPAQSPCHWCATMDCIAACPSGALRREGEAMPAPIAKARIDPDACLVAAGTLCDTCAQYCPTSIRAISMVARVPRIDEEACVGCGLCAYHCDAPGSAIAVEPIEGA
ncbi:4Fe-4S dicluster domain-containing protein [bacterium]|nr:4Fe-4S dicluster domain-containing protein [bacterium]